MKEITTNTKTYEVGDYRVDITDDGKMREAWFYHKDFGVKMFLFGNAVEYNSEKTFIEMVEEEIPYATRDYREEYMNEVERDERLPASYCEIEYEDMESEEAVRGCAFDDMNYLRYMER